MDIQSLHKLIDEWASKQPLKVGEPPEAQVIERRLPEGQRAVRTKSSGDKVYLLDDNQKTRQWVTNPEVLQSLGFEQTEVVEVDDSELLKYNMGSAIYKAS